jgi:hypothetical protein
MPHDTFAFACLKMAISISALFAFHWIAMRRINTGEISQIAQSARDGSDAIISIRNTALITE